ncbi:HSP20-like chaperone, partial [Trametes polyzona]
MSPQYTHIQPTYHRKSRSPLSKGLNMLQEEDPRFRSLDRMLARAYLEMQRRRTQQMRAGVFMPRMDVCDDPDNDHITAALELPGMKADQLSVRIENGHLIVEGERSGPHLHNQTCLRSAETSEPEPTNPSSASPPPSHTKYPVQEIKYGKFRREVKLPEGVMAAHVRSTLAEGMLTISWPREPSTCSAQARTAQAASATTAASQNPGGGGGD